nr:cytochrome P450 76A2-like [Ipomoea batatas]
MEWEWKYLVWSAILLIPALIVLLSRKKSSCSYRLPPGPPGFPVFGNMFDLGALPHQSIAEMKNKYGSVIWLRIGTVRTMAILSAKAAAELFKNHDVSFADRKVIDAMKVQGYHKGSLAFAPYGSYWRLLRRIGTVELFVHKRINETVPVRRKCIDDMLLWIEKEASSVQRGTGVHVAHFVFLATFNLLGNLILSRDLVDPRSDRASKFFDALGGVIQWFGTPNISDIFPAIFLIPGLVFLFARKKSSCSYRLPPGPPGLPVFGNMFDLGALPHQTIAEMKNKYGSVIWLRIGSVRTMAILSAKAAAELFKNHDVSFADRKLIDAMKIEKEASSVQRGTGVHVAHFVFLSTFNLLGNLFLSRDLVDPMSDKASKFFDALKGIAQLFGTPNISDIFPGLRWLDFQGLRRKADRDVRTALEIVSTLVKDRMNEDRQESGKRKDFLDVLLEFEGNGKNEPAKLSEHEINIFVTDLIIVRLIRIWPQSAHNCIKMSVKSEIRQMEWEWKYLVWSAIFLISGLVFLFARMKSSCSYRLPPGPPGLPVIGNMLDLGAFPHQAIAEMKNKYGSVIWLRIGSVSTMAILSAKAAAELFKNHDVSFADRKVIDAMKVQGYHKGSLAFAPYGSYWRLLRRIGTVELFAHKRINEAVPVRRKCIDDMLLWIEKEASSVQRGTGVHVAHFVFLSTFNLMGNLFLSRDLVDPMSDKASKFFDATMGVLELFGTPNISDTFPGLRWLDFQGLRRKADRDVRTALEIAMGRMNQPSYQNMKSIYL